MVTITTRLYSVFDHITTYLRLKIADIRNTQRLRKARMDAGLKIKDLAEIIGVTEDTVINWELRGMRPWRRDIRNKVKQFFEN